MRRNPAVPCAMLAAAFLAAAAQSQTPVGTAFTYQGRLSDGGSAANGTYDFYFRLCEDVGGTMNIGDISCADNVLVVDGLFSTEIDFGLDAFGPYERWLKIQVRPDTGGDCEDNANFTELAPLRKLTPSPLSRIAADGEYSTIGGGEGNLAQGQHVTVGGGMDNVISGTISRGTFVLPPSHATIAGGHANYVGAQGGAIGGGQFNEVDGSDGVVAGGSGNSMHGTLGAIVGGTSNLVSEGTLGAFIGGGDDNGVFIGKPVPKVLEKQAPVAEDGQYAVIGGGSANSVIAGGGVIAGGVSNRIEESMGSIGGGRANFIGRDVAKQAVEGIYATIAGGGFNQASGLSPTVGGGFLNHALADYSVVAGGLSNVVADTFILKGATTTTYGGAIGGGQDNVVTASFGTVAGGAGNQVTTDNSTIAGGDHNQADGFISFIGGGQQNWTYSDFSTIAGGSQNFNNSSHGVIGGGYSNVAGIEVAKGGSVQYATIAGGDDNTVQGSNATVGGGTTNTANGQSATVPGGANNAANGNFSFAAGRRAKTNATGTFVWADGTNADYTRATANEFAARASGGVVFHTSSNLSTGVQVSAGSGTWSSVSDRNAKENIEEVESREVLEKIAAMPVATWNYRTEEGGVKHMGPMAQDFRAAFGLGVDDKSITTVDADGVALAAIKGLNAKLEGELARKDSEIEELRQQLDELRKAVAAMQEKQ